MPVPTVNRLDLSDEELQALCVLTHVGKCAVKYASSAEFTAAYIVAVALHVKLGDDPFSTALSKLTALLEANAARDPRIVIL